MFLTDWIRLPGPSSLVTRAPQVCACGGKEFFRQPDFRRSLGLWVVSLATLATFVLLYFHADWITTWSPMFAVVVIDRLLAWTSPTVLICYDCEHLYRGLPKSELAQAEAFDLEVFDRHQYAKNEKAEKAGLTQ